MSRDVLLNKSIQTFSLDAIKSICNILSFLSNFGVNFLLVFCLHWLKFHKDLKLLSLFKKIIRKLF
jgi:hypothetical protein